MKKSKLWQGLSGVAVFLFVLILSLTVLANSYAMLVNDALGLSTSGLTLSGSDYGGEDGTLTDEGYEELIADSYAFCIEEEEEGAVGRLLAMLSSPSCGACTAGVLAVEDEEAAGFISLSVTAYK